MLDLLICRNQEGENRIKSMRLRATIKRAIADDISIILMDEGNKTVINCPYISRSRTITNFILQNNAEDKKFKVIK